MTSTTLLGQLSSLHASQIDLLTSIPATDCARRFHPRLASLNWYFGRGVYLELLWLRERLQHDDDLSMRVEELFSPNALSLEQQCSRLPPVDHLINWGSEIHDEHLRRLATPSALPDHPWLHHDRLPWFLLQEQAKLYEAMLTLLNQRSLQERDQAYQCKEPLEPGVPKWETREISQGHYRIGARDEPRAYDNELPPQAVELSSFRIALTPVSNAQYLSFMQADGYSDESLWSNEGLKWLNHHNHRHPEYWRQDHRGGWYEVAINGISHLPPNEPVTGISHYEAEAFCNWVGRRESGEFTGAVIQHEYQWELAVRTGVVSQMGCAWEWCGNRYHHYPSFQPFPGARASTQAVDDNCYSLRGASLHTQPMLRRASFRHWAMPSDHHQFTTVRLVFPPRHQWSS
ncbi:MAG: formylglycine-generating enzyme family protein [Candidatus Thiodiazotropha taylori]|nr:formylglycine-generating enzyme family protein [Candidatus Thiodiazotropha taylori]MCW4224568.1 formylglycine-generating enzyme family protein [Candidatus Thiodiazotropha endolucinida]MCG7886142.1 formylglycine-generating enzyme family protein [Candidatus Thiodiazotropha taylori]MCG7889789.1 formylglycine-generating enzyme family protein [Candidatus Thiodiazotropha taylori]MCG8031071.1 formylglycine-generating enzyme family protein [Candidatus Thiodiazotropha taylori]